MVKANHKAVVIFILFVAMLLSGCKSSKSEFTGSKTCNDDQFLVDFEVLNKTVDGTLKLSAGDEIKVTISIDEGSLDICIKDPSGHTIYKADDAETSCFLVKTDSDGEYTCIVTGDDAQGSVHFVSSVASDK